MIWQDFIFLAGSIFSIFCLAPTLRNATARVPVGTSVPSMTIGGIYALAFASLGMTFSAAGSMAAATMWLLIAILRSPTDGPTLTRREELLLFAADVRRWAIRSVHGRSVEEQYLLEPDHDSSVPTPIGRPSEVTRERTMRSESSSSDGRTATG